jgi:RHS repeat-associated protein
MSKDGSGNSSYERAFRYYYDAMGRDTAAIYAERTTAGTGAFTVTHGWDENRITYDQNGNILSLFRNATTQGTGGHSAIDNLTYTYDTANPNQLKSVADATGSTTGFRSGTGNYSYDGNGNLASDPYKGIGSLTYNVLNRTDKISFSSSANRYIDYTYDADGSLIRKRQYDDVSGVLTLKNTTDYIDGFVYLNGTLQYFAMPEGRVLNSAGTLSREFSLADQQGNVRISFDNTGTGGTAKVRQENSYYAFGMIMPGSIIGTPTNDNKHLYNGGSEWQNDYGNLPDYYQTYYRNYDAAIGRWVGVDPDPESVGSMTVYQYGNDNPVLYNDPLGNRAEYQDYAKVNQHTGDAGQEMNSWLDQEMAGAAARAERLNKGDITGMPGAIHVAMYVDQDGNVSYMSANLNSTVVTQNSSNTWVFRDLANDRNASQGGAQQSGFVGDNWKDIGFLANDLTQSFINRNTTLAISEGYNLAKSTVFLPLGLATRTSTGALSALSRTGGLLAKAAPWVAAGSIGINIAVNKQVTAGDVYQSIVTGASLIPGWGLIVGGGALALEGASYYFTGKSVSDNINSNLNGGVIYSWK